MRIVIVDADKNFVEQIKEYVKRFMDETGIDCTLARYSSGVDFISDFNAVFDVVFMETELSIMDGIETASRLRQIDMNIPIIFMTNATHMAIRGYEVGALDFVAKPVSYPTFTQKLKKALVHTQKNNNYSLILKMPDGFKRIYVRDIKYIEVFGHFLIYHTKHGDVQVRGSLVELEKELERYYFIRCSNCFLVNLRHVEGFTATTVEIDGLKLPISRRKKKEFAEQLSSYLGGGK